MNDGLEGTGPAAARDRLLRGRRIVVTGANGFVGRATCTRLRELGANVVGCVRRGEAIGQLPVGIEARVVGNMFSPDAWHDVVRGAHAVIHLVARTHVADDGNKSLLEYRRTNVDITRAILDASIDNEIPRFVFASSIKAVGEGADQPYDESTPCSPRGAYGVTKREAELLVHGECWGGSTSAVAIRSPLVYGPGVGGNFSKLVRAVDRGLPLPLGRVQARRSLIHVDNLADALATAAGHRFAGGMTFHVADDGMPPTVRELVERIARHLGRNPRLLPVPRLVLRAAGRLTGRSDQIERLVGPLTVSTRAIRSRLGWSAPVDADSGLRETIAWYQRANDGAPGVVNRPRHAA